MDKIAVYIKKKKKKQKLGHLFILQAYSSTNMECNILVRILHFTGGQAVVK